MQESPTSTLPPDQLVGGGRNVDLPKQANTQAQDQLDNALEPATKSPVRKAATGGTPGPDSLPDGALTNQGQVSPHTTPPTGTRALNETPPNDGKRPIAKGAAVPSGSDSFLTHLPSIPAFKRRGSKKAKARVSPLDSENGNSRAATPTERDTATAAKTPLTGSPVANNAAEPQAPEDSTGGAPASPATPINKSGLPSPEKTNPTASRNLSIEWGTPWPTRAYLGLEAEVGNATPQGAGLSRLPKNFVHTGKLSKGDIPWMNLTREEQAIVALKSIDSMNKKSDDTFVAVAFEAAHDADPRQGYGLYARRDLKEGTDLGSYAGEVLTKQDLEDRYPNSEGEYVIELDPNRFVDAADVRLASQARFANQPATAEGEPPNAEYYHTGSKAVLRIIGKVKKGHEIRVLYRQDGGAHCSVPTPCVPASAAPKTAPTHSLYEAHAARRQASQQGLTQSATEADLQPAETAHDQDPIPLTTPAGSNSPSTPQATDESLTGTDGQRGGEQQEQRNKKGKHKKNTIHIASFHQQQHITENITDPTDHAITMDTDNDNNASRGEHTSTQTKNNQTQEPTSYASIAGGQQRQKQTQRQQQPPPSNPNPNPNSNPNPNNSRKHRPDTTVW